MELLALKDKQYKSLDSQFKNLNEKHNILQNKFYLLEKDSEEMKRKLAINDNHEKLENIFSKLSSLILATKTDEDLNLEYKERYLIKELFGGRSSRDIDNQAMKPNKICNINIENEFTDDEAILNNLAESFMNQTNSNSCNHRSKSGCATRRRKRKINKAGLALCKSIDLNFQS